MRRWRDLIRRTQAVVSIDGVTHLETGRTREPKAFHLVPCHRGVWRRVQPGDALLDRRAAVTCLWCAAL